MGTATIAKFFRKPYEILRAAFPPKGPRRLIAWQGVSSSCRSDGHEAGVLELEGGALGGGEADGGADGVTGDRKLGGFFHQYQPIGT